MYVQAVLDYMRSPIKNPFFLAVGDEDYIEARNQIRGLGFREIRLSSDDYFNDKNRPPSIDRLIDTLKDTEGKNVFVVGLGECLSLQGAQAAIRKLTELRDIPTTGKVVLLLRTVASHVAELRFKPGDEPRRRFIAQNTTSNIGIITMPPTLGFLGALSLQETLVEVEDVEYGSFKVNHETGFPNSTLGRHITSAFEGVWLFSHNLRHDYGTDELWKKFLQDLYTHGSLKAVFEHHELANNLEAKFDDHIDGTSYQNWLYFIALKTNPGQIPNPYLRFVADKTDTHGDFKPNILNAILDVPLADSRFAEFYAQRKALAKNFSDGDFAAFVSKNRINPAESLFRLTDSSQAERGEIVAWAGTHGWHERIDKIYPDLAAYRQKSHLNCAGKPELSQLLTEYFHAYKQQKIANKIEADFLAHVSSLATQHIYKQLPTRISVLEALNVGYDDTFLLWIDALGVEYTSYIQELARRHKLKISIRLARCELPSITKPFNSSFFYTEWTGEKKQKISTLDEVKHRPEKSGVRFERDTPPTYLANELNIITAAMGDIAAGLKHRNYTKALIVSDHGASRLARLHTADPYPTGDDPTITGEYSGRCCKTHPTNNMPFAIEENGYLALADYGRFEGSRSASVEVHGGASLEEVVIPIIEITLSDATVDVSLVYCDVFVDRKTGFVISLFSEYKLTNLYIILRGKRYDAAAPTPNHFEVAITDILTSPKDPLSFDVYCDETGDRPIRSLTINTKSRAAQTDLAFDDFFEEN